MSQLHCVKLYNQQQATSYRNMQTVSPSFHAKSQAGIRKHNWSLLFSFDKEFDDSRTFFMLNSSILDGTDVLKPVDDNPIQYWDYYTYVPYTDRVISLEWEREIDFPYSIQSATATVILNNFDNYFSSHTNSPINQYLIPSRPMKLFSGYDNEPLLQQFVGLTQDKPKLDQKALTAQFDSLDYLSELFQLQLSESVSLSNVRTDEALAALFAQFGILPFQYVLARGRNVIPFLFLAEGLSAADCFRQIMEAEGGQLWIDEQGIIRFDQRLVSASGPIMTFNESNISRLDTSADTEIINRVQIISNIRGVQDVQLIHAGSGQLTSPTLSSPVIVPAGAYVTYNINLDNPLAGYSEPTLGFTSGDSWFTVSTALGDNIVSFVSVTDSVLTLNQLSITFHNTNAFDAYLDAIEVYGEPAKIIDTLNYEAYDQDSIDEYGEHLLQIKNDLFGSESNCESFAYTTLDAYAQFDSIIDISVKGDPALQLGDIIWIDTAKVEGQFQITKISNAINPSGVSQDIMAKRYNPRHWFVLNQSLLDGGNVLAP
jgi:hypothetical protein